MKGLPSRTVAAESLTIENRTRTQDSPMRTWRIIVLTNFTIQFVALCSRVFSLMQIELINSDWTMVSRSGFRPPLVSKTQFESRIHDEFNPVVMGTL